MSQLNYRSDISAAESEAVTEMIDFSKTVPQVHWSSKNYFKNQDGGRPIR